MKRFEPFVPFFAFSVLALCQILLFGATGSLLLNMLALGSVILVAFVGFTSLVASHYRQKLESFQAELKSRPDNFTTYHSD